MRGKTPDTTWLADTDILGGGHPALDFVNTIHSRMEPVPRDYLETTDHLLGWCLYQNFLSVADARRLMTLSPARSTRLLREARTLRETLYIVFRSHIDGRRPATALEKFNRALERSARWRALTATKDGFVWHYLIDTGHPQSLFAPLVFDAAELLRSPELARLKACPPPDGCGWLFLDRSRNGSRTWCNMKTCGNVAKQRRHRARRRDNG